MHQNAKQGCTNAPSRNEQMRQPWHGAIVHPSYRRDYSQRNTTHRRFDRKSLPEVVTAHRARWTEARVGVLQFPSFVLPGRAAGAGADRWPMSRARARRSWMNSRARRKTRLAGVSIGNPLAYARDPDATGPGGRLHPEAAMQIAAARTATNARGAAAATRARGTTTTRRSRPAIREQRRGGRGQARRVPCANSRAVGAHSIPPGLRA